MDHESFDDLVRLLSTPGSRRAALATLLGLGVAGAAETAGARKSRTRDARRKGRGKRQGSKRLRAEAVCFGGSPCTPGPGKNLGKCDFGGTPAQKNTALKGKNLKGVNLGGANLANADASGANLTGANLDKACLVDAILSGAIINNSTNFGSALFCRTTMPDGSTNDSGCDRGTLCCPTCDAAHPCDQGEVCCDGRCRSGECCDDGDCPGAVCCNRQCCDAGQVCNTNPNPDRCCSPGGACAAGFCGSVPDGCGGRLDCPCGTDLTCCAETCKNLQTDPDNCGICGRECGPCQTCVNGVCGGGCAGWQTCQSGTCTPTCASRCPAANCSTCVGLADNTVQCGAGLIVACDDFVCTSGSQCTDPATGNRCVLTTTSKFDNTTSPICDDRPGGECATILPCG